MHDPFQTMQRTLNRPRARIGIDPKRFFGG
jgi:hypothetical protein